MSLFVAFIGDMAMGEHAGKVIDDTDEKTLDAFPATAYHRHIDIPLAAAHNEGENFARGFCILYSNSI